MYVYPSSMSISERLSQFVWVGILYMLDPTGKTYVEIG
jgi:hypothetical protein